MINSLDQQPQSFLGCLHPFYKDLPSNQSTKKKGIILYIRLNAKKKNL